MHTPHLLTPNPPWTFPLYTTLAFTTNTCYDPRSARPYIPPSRPTAFSSSTPVLCPSLDSKGLKVPSRPKMLASEQRSNSHSPSRGGLGSKFSALGAKLSRTFSNTNDVEQDSTHSGLPVLPKGKFEFLRASGEEGMVVVRVQEAFCDKR